MNAGGWSAVVAGAYFLGSIPFGILFSIWLRGLDPRQHGSGNTGFTNVLRSAGWLPGILTLIGDMGKGALAVHLAGEFSGSPEARLVAGIAAVAGHIFPVWLRFAGGKGVATGFGVLLAADPGVGAVLVAIWMAVVAMTRFSSLGAVTSFMLLPLAAWWMQESILFRWFSIGLSGLIVFRHRSNIVRLWRGVEPRMGGS